MIQINRIERLTAIVLLLQSGKRTAAEIADRFEVSRRTILRDIQGLSEMGIPIIALPGVSGGYTLPPDYSLPPLALTWHEATLLRLALSSLTKLGSTPFKPACESLLAKVQLLFPHQTGADVAQLQDMVSLDVPTRRYPTPFLDSLVAAAGAKQWVSAVYRSENGVSRQTIQPMLLRSSAGLWYCEAYSHERQAVRVYRVDRFLEASPAKPPVESEPPASAVPHVDPSFPEVRIELTVRGVLRLEHEPHLGRHLQCDESGAGRLSLHLRPDEYGWLARVLLGLGTDATVVSPPELRTQVQQAAEEIARHYACRPAPGP